ncbi:MAG TPA: hypothetical protein VGI16_12915 [Candidatus Acidoferrum sp.]
MSRKLAVVFLAMLVLTAAMGLKTIATTHGDNTVMMANGGAPVPPMPYRNGGAPVPPMPYKNGGAPVPPMPYRNGGAPVPPMPY